MPQLTFHYGAMRAGKSIEILKIAYNYEIGHHKVLLLTPAIADRDGFGVIASRIGLKREAVTVADRNELEMLLFDDDFDYDVVLIDEAQFLSSDMVELLAHFVADLDVPVLAFGLKTDAFSHLFEGSKRLLELADKLVEMKTICTVCDRKATMNLRLINNKPVYKGDVVEIGDSQYLPVCTRHYFSFPKEF